MGWPQSGKSYTHDKLHDPEAEIRQTYLIGDLALQLRRLDEAVHWFNETVNHAEIGSAPGLESRARQRWASGARGGPQRARERRLTCFERV